MSRKMVQMMGVLFLSAGVLQAALIDLKFNGSGRSAINEGTLGHFTFRDRSKAMMDLHSADRLGVSGKAGDRAFDNSDAVAMGGAGGRAGTLSVRSGPLPAFTIAGWFKTASTEPIGGSVTLLVWQDADSQVIVGSPKPGKLQLQVNQRAAVTAESYTATEKWVFFAVTYDSSLAGKQAKFYVGDKDTPVSLVSEVNLAGGVPDIESVPSLGAMGAYKQAFDGLLDNFYMDSAALDMEAVEALRREALP